MRRIANILKWVLLLGYFPVMLAFVSASNRAVICSDVRVVVRDSLETGFITAAEIRRSILNQYPDLLGSRMQGLNMNEMEAFVSKSSFVRNCQIFNSPSGVLNVVVKQHQPILRVFASDGTYYLDESGRKVPVSKRFSARVLVANGNIPADKTDLVRVAGLIDSDPFWKAQMEQIYIRRNNDYVLVPRVGDQLILLGKPEKVEEKLRNLRALYDRGLDPREWNNYLLINLKYEGQVICSRKRDF